MKKQKILAIVLILITSQLVCTATDSEKNILYHNECVTVIASDFEERYGLFDRIIADTKKHFESSIHSDKKVYQFTQEDFSIVGFELGLKNTAYIITLDEERMLKAGITTRIGFFVVAYVKSYPLVGKRVDYLLKNYTIFDITDSIRDAWSIPLENKEGILYQYPSETTEKKIP